MDLLVRLYALQPVAPRLEALALAGATVRRALASERHVVVEPGRAATARPGWASECEVVRSRVGRSRCFVAHEGAWRRSRLAACLATRRAPETRSSAFRASRRRRSGFFGPQLVRDDRRGRGVGAALLLVALHALAAEGHAYAIVGWASELEFYRRVAGAVPIAGSEPGLYRAPLVP